MEVSATIFMCLGGVLIFAGVLGFQNIGDSESRPTVGGFIDGFLGGPIAFIRGFLQGARDKRSPLRSVLIIFLVGVVLLSIGLCMWIYSPDKPTNSEQADAGNRRSAGA